MKYFYNNLCFVCGEPTIAFTVPKLCCKIPKCIYLCSIFLIFRWSRTNNHEPLTDPFLPHKRLLIYAVFIGLPSFEPIPVSFLLNGLFLSSYQTVPDILSYCVWPTFQSNTFHIFLSLKRVLIFILNRQWLIIYRARCFYHNNFINTICFSTTI